MTTTNEDAIASAIREGFAGLYARLDDVLTVFDTSGGPGRGVLVELGERPEGRLPVHHVAKVGKGQFMAVYDENQEADNVDGQWVEGTLAGAEYYTKQNSEDPSKTSHKVQFLFKTSKGLLPLEAGATSAFTCGMIRQLNYFMATGGDVRREQLLIHLKGGEKKAVLADISTSQGEIRLPRGSGGKWALYVEGTNPPKPLPLDQQPWLPELMAFLDGIRRQGLIAIDPETKAEANQSDNADQQEQNALTAGEILESLVKNASTLDEVKAGLRTIADSALYELTNPYVALQRQILVEKQFILKQNEGDIDREALMSCSEEELTTLGWSSEDGRQFLSRRYQCRSRQHLNDEQLMDFVGYLRARNRGYTAS